MFCTALLNICMYNTLCFRKKHLVLIFASYRNPELIFIIVGTITQHKSRRKCMFYFSSHLLFVDLRHLQQPNVTNFTIENLTLKQ